MEYDYRAYNPAQAQPWGTQLQWASGGWGGAASHDPRWASWYAQQQHQHPQAPPPQQPQQQEAPPPLPSEPPPDEAPPGTEPVAPGSEAAKQPGATPAADAQASQQQQIAAAVQAAAQQAQHAAAWSNYYQQQQQQQHVYAAAYGYVQQPQGYAGYEQQAAPQQQAPVTWNFAANTPHASQVSASPSAAQQQQQQQQPAASPASALGAAGHSAAGLTTIDFTRLSSAKKPTVIKPAQLTALSITSPAGAARAAGAGGVQSAAPAGAAGGSGNQSVDAMRAAAAAVAQRLTAGGSAPGVAHTQPAYVAVGGAGAALQQQPAAGQQGGGGGAADAARELPLSLQSFVARALSLKGRTQAARLELRIVLRDLIAKHKKAGTLWSTDWDREPLPLLASEARAAAAAAAGGGGEHSGRGGVWDRLGPSPGAGSGSGRKRAWGGDGSSSGHSSDEDGGWGRGGGSGGAGKRRQKLDVGGRGGRCGRGGKKGGKQQQQQWLSAEDAARQARRSARFAGGGGGGGEVDLRAAYGWDETAAAAGSFDFIAGSCERLEKAYFRLTRAPLPEEVRPQRVLQAALARLAGMIRDQADKYLYYNDQFKAMRQDLTVQGIKNDFTVEVYEAHARAALEYGDTAEYNQCQTQLAILYAAGRGGCHAEFGAYRLLYQAVHAAAGEGRKLLGTMRQLLGNKVGQVADSDDVQHALQVREALSSCNVSRFFRLYVTAPRLGRRLMDDAVKPLRWRGLNALVRAHKPAPLPLAFLARALGFLLPPEAVPAAAGAGAAPGQGGASSRSGDGGAAGAPGRRLAAATVGADGQLLPGCSEASCLGEHTPSLDEREALAACLEWCRRHGAIFDSQDAASSALLTKECWSRLAIPADTEKVAHGDANLDIRDFLTGVLA